MCALSPLFSSSLGWPLLDIVPLEIEQSNSYQFPNSFEHFLLPSPPSCSQIFNDNNTGNNLYGYDGSYGGDDRTVVRKLSHNASERDRRKKLNSLYSSLRSLLPASDQNKKLSIPSTVSHAVKYIPELQQEVERLSKKRDEIQRRVWRQGNESAEEEKTRVKAGRSGCVCVPGIMMTRFTDKEIGIQISMMQGSPLSELLVVLEECGFSVVGASSFVSSSPKTFYNLLLQMQGNCQLDGEELRDRLISLYNKIEELLTLVQAAQF